MSRNEIKTSALQLHRNDFEKIRLVINDENQGFFPHGHEKNSLTLLTSTERSSVFFKYPCAPKSSENFMLRSRISACGSPKLVRNATLRFFVAGSSRSLRSAVGPSITGILTSIRTSA